MRQVLVKEAPAEKLVSSGTLTSVTNWAWSQIRVGVGVSADVDVATLAGCGVGVWVGAEAEADVLVTLGVTAAGGWTIAVNWAATVIAAAVKAALGPEGGSGVAWGKLQAVSALTMSAVSKMERRFVDILLLVDRYKHRLTNCQNPVKQQGVGPKFAR
jgi:hypothetical protein